MGVETSRIPQALNSKKHWFLQMCSKRTNLGFIWFYELAWAASPCEKSGADASSHPRFLDSVKCQQHGTLDKDVTETTWLGDVHQEIWGSGIQKL